MGKGITVQTVGVVAQWERPYGGSLHWPALPALVSSEASPSAIGIAKVALAYQRQPERKAVSPLSCPFSG